jgi:anti-anti-sigma factor
LGRVPLVEVVITEELDTRAVPRLRALLGEALLLRPEQLLVDLAGCPFIDAAGIGVLLDAHRQALRDGGRLTLREPSPRLHRTLRLARVAHVLHIVGPGRTGDR